MKTILYIAGGGLILWGGVTMFAGYLPANVGTSIPLPPGNNNLVVIGVGVALIALPHFVNVG